jgi:uncharacterized protein (DUF302 family)
MKPRPGPVSFDLLKAESFIRGESTLSVVRDEPFDQVAACLEVSLVANRLVIVHVHDLDGMLLDQGIALGFRCRVYAVSDAALAAQLLALDAGLAHMLPCRIAMHDQGGVVTVTVPRPAILMSELSYAAPVARVARSFEAAFLRVLEGLQ